MSRSRPQSGFSLIELLIVVSIMFIIIGFALPSLIQTVRNARVSGDSQNLNGEILMAKMRAAANFTAARVRFDTTARTYIGQMWCRYAGAFTGCVAGTVNTWVNVNVDGPQFLASGVSFGVGNQTQSPPASLGGPGGAIATGPVCTVGAAGTTFSTGPGAGANVANTVCILFNSRGFPVGNNGSALGTEAVYINDVDQVYGTTVSITGLTANWRHDRANTTATNWVKR